MILRELYHDQEKNIYKYCSAIHQSQTLSEFLQSYFEGPLAMKKQIRACKDLPVFVSYPIFTAMRVSKKWKTDMVGVVMGAQLTPSTQDKSVKEIASMQKKLYEAKRKQDFLDWFKAKTP